MSDNGLQKWDYVMVDSWFVKWEYVDNPKKRAEEGLDSQTDWEGEKTSRPVFCRPGLLMGGRMEEEGFWVALGPPRGPLRPQLAVLRGLGRNGWEVVGVQTTGLFTGEWENWYHPTSTFVLKRPLRRGGRPLGT